MSRHHQHGQVWIINDNGYWTYIEDAEGQTLVDIDYWTSKQKVDKDVISLALISDTEKALEWAQDRNREIMNDDVHSVDDEIGELNYQYHLSRQVT